MTGIKKFLDFYKIEEKEVLFIPYGSYVYGTNNKNSDNDYIAIILNNSIPTGEEFSGCNTNIQTYTKKDFQSQLNLHKIHTLEAYFHTSKILLKYFNFNLNLRHLRHELSQKSSHSFVKAKKKIEVEKDYYIGWKSLFHSLRILVFGIQIAKYGKIIDYSAANQFWVDILSANQYEWNYFKEKYKPIYNELASEFRKLAPK